MGLPLNNFLKWCFFPKLHKFCFPLQITPTEFLIIFTLQVPSTFKTYPWRITLLLNPVYKGGGGGGGGEERFNTIAQYQDILFIYLYYCMKIYAIWLA